MSRRRPTRPASPHAAASSDAKAASFTRDAAVIFTVAFVLRALHIWQLHGSPFFTALMGDARGYDLWARELAGGDWIGREVFYQAPLYPYVLGLLYWQFGRDLVVIRVVQAAVGSLACVGLGYAGARLVSRPAGLSAGLLLATYAPAIFFDALIQKSVLDVFLICAALAVIGTIMSHGASPRLWVTLGLTLGALALTRENAIALAAVVIAWSLAHTKDRRAALLVAAGLTLVLTPVVIRNYVVSGDFYLTTSQFGSNLYIGNNPKADGGYVALRPGRGSPEFERQDARELAEQAAGRSLTPAEVSSHWIAETLRFIREQPGAWLQLTARKVRLLAGAEETIDTESLESHAEWSWVLAIARRLNHFGTLLPLAVIGLWSLWPQRQRLWIVPALALIYAATLVVFFVVARYRYPLVPFLALFAAAGVIACIERWREANLRPLLAPAAVAAVVAVASNWPIRSADARRVITETNLAAALHQEGRLEDSIAHYRRALEVDANYAPAHANLGIALRAAGRDADAIASYQRAIALQPGQPTVYFNLGNLYFAQGRRDDAIAEFRKALALAPTSVEAHNNIGLALASGGEIDEAIRHFERAIAIDPLSPRAHSNLGNALASKGAAREGIVHLKRAVDLEPRNAGTRYDLASVYLEAGDLEDAIREYREVLAIEPRFAAAYNNLGIALASSGQLDEAIAHWRQAIAIDPGYGDAQRNLATALKGR